MEYALGIEASRIFSSAPDEEWTRYFEGLRRQRKLCDAVHQMNELLRSEHHKERAEEALKRAGLWHGG
jgi:hypothetical protein